MSLKNSLLSLAVRLVLFLAASPVVAQDAMIDLSSTDFSQGGTYPIAGQWKFYWNQLLTPADFAHKNIDGEWMGVSSGWNRQSGYPALGFATYRTTVKLPFPANGLAIYFPEINAATRIWVNGEKAAESGNAVADKKLYRSRLIATVVSVPPNLREVDLIVQVVNYTAFSGGFSGTPQLGNIAALMSRLNQTQGIENFFAGSLMAMFIYQLILYTLFHRGKPYLWLSLICLGVALRALIVHDGSFLLPNLFPGVSWEIWKKMEFVSVYAMIAFFPLYIVNLFYHETPRWPIKFFVSFSLLLCLMVVVTPQHIYGGLLDFGHAALLLAFLYAVYSVGKASKRGNKDARIIFAGVVVSFPFILAEIMKNSWLYHFNIQLPHLVEMGVLVFLLFQVYLLANHYANSYKNLESLNQNLEKIVTERTGELITTNRVKDRLLSIVSHDIKSPLNSLRGILTIYNKGGINQEEFKYYSKKIEDDLVRTGLLVDNILYWTASQLRGTEAKFEKIDLKDIVKENAELFHSMAGAKNLAIKNEITENHWVNFDRQILNLTLRNLISNAIKFSHPGDKIIIGGQLTEKASLLQVIDFGVGMSDEVLQSLQGTQAAKSSAGTGNERGTGLGLSFCREYLQMTGGELTIESDLGKGSTLTILIPQKAGRTKSLIHDHA